jgi:hypothetical protein
VTRKRLAPAAQPAVIDACCLIDLLASGQAEAILRATGHAWHLPAAVQAEVRYVRQHDPDNPGTYKNTPADLSPLVKSALLTTCQPDNPHEEARYVHYATIFRSDGEAMCLALGECRGWIVATDDRRAVKTAKQARLSVITCPELVKAWADTNRPSETRIFQVLSDIQTLAQFRPSPEMPEASWWLERVETGNDR